MEFQPVLQKWQSLGQSKPEVFANAESLSKFFPRTQKSRLADQVEWAMTDFGLIMIVLMILVSLFVIATIVTLVVVFIKKSRHN